MVLAQCAAQQCCSPSSKILLSFQAQQDRSGSEMFPFLLTPLELLAPSRWPCSPVFMWQVLWVPFVFFQLQKRKGTTRGGRKQCLMLERTPLPKESHGWLASSQRSHERSCHSLQCSLTVSCLPPSLPPACHQPPRTPASSSAQPGCAPLGPEHLPGCRGGRRHHLS